MPAPQKKLLLLTAALALFLCGCGGQPLSDREIVRAVFFTEQDSTYSACLLLADQNGEDTAYKTASAQGSTAAQALSRAEKTLSGNVYYGLLDLAAFPPESSLRQLRTIGQLLYDKAQPAPELSVFLLPDATLNWQEDAASLYEELQALEQKYRLHCGLQQLFANDSGCAVPGAGEGTAYTITLLSDKEASVRCSGLSAQLAAILCGLSDRLAESYAAGSAYGSADAALTVQDQSLRLCLRDVELQNLSGNSDIDLQSTLNRELQQAFADLIARPAVTEADLFHLQFWHANLYGPDSPAAPPTLSIIFE